MEIYLNFDLFKGRNDEAVRINIIKADTQIHTPITTILMLLTPDTSLLNDLLTGDVITIVLYKYKDCILMFMKNG